jgi:hypothetical protein
MPKGKREATKSFMRRKYRSKIVKAVHGRKPSNRKKAYKF